MQMPKDRQPVETAAAANTWNGKYLNCSEGLEISGTSTTIFMHTEDRVARMGQEGTEGFSFIIFS